MTQSPDAVHTPLGSWDMVASTEHPQGPFTDDGSRKNKMTGGNGDVKKQTAENEGSANIGAAGGCSEAGICKSLNGIAAHGQAAKASGPHSAAPKPSLADACTTAQDKGRTVAPCKPSSQLPAVPKQGAEQRKAANGAAHGQSSPASYKAAPPPELWPMLKLLLLFCGTLWPLAFGLFWLIERPVSQIDRLKGELRDVREDLNRQVWQEQARTRACQDHMRLQDAFIAGLQAHPASSPVASAGEVQLATAARHAAPTYQGIISQPFVHEGSAREGDSSTASVSDVVTRRQAGAVDEPRVPSCDSSSTCMHALGSSDIGPTQFLAQQAAVLQSVLQAQQGAAQAALGQRDADIATAVRDMTAALQRLKQLLKGPQASTGASEERAKAAEVPKAVDVPDFVEVEIIAASSKEGRPKFAPLLLVEKAAASNVTGTKTALPMRFGSGEGHAIKAAVQGKDAHRPRVYDTMATLMHKLKIEVEHVVISLGEHGDTFADVHYVLPASGARAMVDARPVDALILALRAEARILVKANVMQEHGRPYHA